MAESSSLQSIDELQLLQAALGHPFEPAEVPLSSTDPSSPSSSSIPTPASDVAPPPEPASPSSSSISSEDEVWKSTYSAHVSAWRAQSASARTKAELTRAQWEAIRAGEATERSALGQLPESWDHLGDHIVSSTTAASEAVAHAQAQAQVQAQAHSDYLSTSVASLEVVEHDTSLGSSQEPSHAQPEGDAGSEPQHGRTEGGSPSQPWEHISSSPTSSYPSLSFPEASVPQSPSHPPVLLASTSGPVREQIHSLPQTDRNLTHLPLSTLPSIMDDRIVPRTRLSLVLSSLAINLLLPFINGVMLGFGEIFAKDVLVGWFGWKTMRHGSTAAGLGLRR